MKKVLLYLLVAAFLLSGVSCSENGTEDKSKPETDSSEAAPVEVEEETEDHYYNHLPERNLNGMEFRIISRITAEDHDVQSYTDYGNNEIDAETIDGTQINDAVYYRNRELETRYNFLFNSIQIDLAPMTTVKTSVLANSDDYDAVVDGMVYMRDYSLLYPLDNLNNMDLSAPCWDQNINVSLSIGNKHYIVMGDMLILDKKGTWCMLFNKNLAANYQLGNLYDIVREGAWTLDTFYSMAKLGSGDLNGDGVQDEGDKWGFLTEGYNINVMMYGCDTRFTAKDEEDYPVLSLYNEHTVSAFDKVLEIMADKSVSLSMSWSKNGPADCLKAFSEDRGLFYMTGIGTAIEFRYMDSDFGIVPIPKYDEEQANYYTSFSMYNAGCVGVPKSIGSSDEIGFILQAICLSSTNTLRTTFYDTVLNGITARDEESSEMLDIIFANRVIDLGFIHNWGGIGDIYGTLLNMNSNKLSSIYTSKEKSATKAIEKAIAEYRDLQ